MLDAQQPCPPTACLASMISATGLERRIFPDADRKLVRQRLREITADPWATQAVREAIYAVHAATVAAAVAATAAASSSGGTGATG